VGPDLSQESTAAAMLLQLTLTRVDSTSISKRSRLFIHFRELKNTLITYSHVI
jgi:hypothetical protein